MFRSWLLEKTLKVGNRDYYLFLHPVEEFNLFFRLMRSLVNKKMNFNVSEISVLGKTEFEYGIFFHIQRMKIYMFINIIQNNIKFKVASLRISENCQHSFDLYK